MALNLAPEPGLFLELEDLPILRETWGRMGRKVVLTNGCFDLLHVGHVQSLSAARALGDVLIVALNDDESVRALKGVGRPVIPLEERAEVLCSLRAVDAVVPFGGLTAAAVVQAARPDVYVKGGDYDLDGHRPPEADLAAALGAAVVFVPRISTRATSEIIERIRSTGS
jgi:D-beta-D-heptose 7-phosphate kinase/D-beta-D-heptose 1-phosphate adenosyltransferase